MNNAITTLTSDIKNYGGARIVINGRKCSFNSVRSYTLYNNAVYGSNDDPEVEIQTETARNNPLFWINLESTVICGDPGHYERQAALWADVPRVSVGDIVEFDGVQFEIKTAPNNNFRPAQI